MPAFPEVARILSLIGGVEVLWQIESHHQRESDGDVGVAREVGIDLERVCEERCQVLESRKQLGIGEYAIDEINSQIVRHHDFLGQAIEDPEHSDAELGARKGITPIELRDEVGRLDDRSGDELREKAHVESEIENIAHRTYEPLVNVGGIGYHLEGIERDADRQNDSVNTPERTTDDVVAQFCCNVGNLEIGSKYLVDHIGKEIAVLEVTEYAEVDGHRQAKQRKGQVTLLDSLVESLLPKMIDALGKEIVGKCDENQKADEKSGCLVIEEQGNQEEISIAHHASPSRQMHA